MTQLQVWTFIFITATFALYLLIAWVSRVRDTKGFYVAGQGVPAIANGMATAADWMSAASFISMAGLISTMGFAGGVYLMGWTGGYVLLALLLAPYLRKFGHFTVPDFIGDRYDSTNARLVAVVCAIFVSFTYVVGQMKGVGVVFSQFLGVSLTVGIFIGMAIVFIYATLGGMKGITWTQVAQYWVLITAFLVPAVAISFKLTGNPVPQLGLGSHVAESIDAAQPFLLQKLNSLQEQFGFTSYTAPGSGPDHPWSKLNVFCVTLALMAGTAGLPHVIIRFYTVKSVQAARWSAFWALLFIAMLYLTAPATAVFARYYMLDNIAGLNGRSGEDLPPWYRSWQPSGLIAWFDLDGDNTVRFTNNLTAQINEAGIAPNEVFRISGVPLALRQQMIDDPRGWLREHGGAQPLQALLDAGAAHHPDKDIIVLATPQMAGLFDWIVAFVAAGGLAAALSTASGLLLVISSSIAHDLYFRVLNPNASEKSRLLIGRVVIAGAVLVAGYFGLHPPGFVGEVVAFAFGLAAASFFPAIVLGIFSKRVGAVPAVTGMAVGIVFTGFYITTQKADAILLSEELARTLIPLDSPLRQPWFFGINAQGIGTVGMLLNFAVTLLLTPLCKGPSIAVQQMVESIREPEDAGAAVAIETAPGH
ncbi:MAG: cation acetate symporter [Phycisphaeraceae bacterium]|nr:cation acetate symporter [Phycisphaeraceae bacterium]